MKEILLQDIWKNKIFNPLNFKDTEGNAIEIIDFGILNTNSGPDFHSAKIKINDIIFFGNIEMHLKSSDWMAHRHHLQKEYNSIILHVVFEHDVDIIELKEKNIPTLELKKYINEDIINNYSLYKKTDFVLCENTFSHKKISSSFYENLILEKLEEKNEEIRQYLEKNKNDYEAVLFQKIAYSFGLKTNAKIFLQISQNIDFSIIKKVLQNPFQLECILLGKADLLNNPNAEKWKKEYNFLKIKFNIDDNVFPAKFFRMMPISFPTIRLSQLAQLYYYHKNLFSKIINSRNINELKNIFIGIKTSEYWENHYIFGKESEKKTKMLSTDFIEIILLNAILPIIYSYNRNKPNNKDFIIKLYNSLSPEKNSIIKKWKELGIKTNSALETQALLYLYKNRCNLKKCINCCLFI